MIKIAKFTILIKLVLFALLLVGCQKVERQNSDDSPPTVVLAVIGLNSPDEIIQITSDTNITISTQSQFTIVASAHDDQGINRLLFKFAPLSPYPCPGGNITDFIIQGSKISPPGSQVPVTLLNSIAFNQQLLDSLKAKCSQPLNLIGQRFTTSASAQNASTTVQSAVLNFTVLE